ncbi:hypothetical protein GALL_196270 [mine drainage metagenome]|uniref:Leucine-binding protein domain-containing protein n=1 Tax=mine drainage metagenome TaxID=410659 RepID=A0A1J5SDP6_9ZZZZ
MFRPLRRLLHLGAACLALAAAPARAAGGPDFDVAFIGGLSGADAYMAQDSLDGFRLGVKHLGGHLGGADFNLVVENDHHDPERDRALVEKMQQDLHPQVILLSSGRRAAAAAAPLAEAGRTFLLLLNDPDPALAGKGCGNYLFSLLAPRADLDTLAAQSLGDQGFKRVAAVVPAADPGRADAFRAAFGGQTLPFAGSRGEMNFRPLLKAIAAAGADAIYLRLDGGMAVNFIRAYGDSGLKAKVPLFGPGDTLDQMVLAAAMPASLGVQTIAAWSEDGDSPANRRLMADFETEYGRLPSYYAALGYDAAMMLDAAVRGADKMFNNDEAMRTAMRRADYPLTRAGLHFDSNQFPLQDYVLRQAGQDARGRATNETRGVIAHDPRSGQAESCPMRWTLPPLPVVKKP